MSKTAKDCCLTGTVISVSLGTDGEILRHRKIFSVAFVNDDKKIVRSFSFNENLPDVNTFVSAGDIQPGKQAYIHGSWVKAASDADDGVYAYFLVKGTHKSVPLTKAESDRYVVDTAEAVKNAQYDEIVFATSWTVADVLESAASQDFLGVDDFTNYDVHDLDEKGVLRRVGRALEDIVGERGNEVLGDILFNIEDTLPCAPKA